jgi:hypothetical protein
MAPVWVMTLDCSLPFALLVLNLVIRVRLSFVFSLLKNHLMRSYAQVKCFFHVYYYASRAAIPTLRPHPRREMFAYPELSITFSFFVVHYPPSFEIPSSCITAPLCLALSVFLS